MAKKKKDPPPLELYLSYVERHSGGDVCEGQENDPWPNYEDAYIDWFIQEISLTKPTKWMPCVQTIQVDFEPKVDQSVNVLYVRYSTGCTFGTTYGAWAIVGIYDEITKAEKVQQAIKDDTYEGYHPWTGYFERLERCEIETLRVAAKFPIIDNLS